MLSFNHIVFFEVARNLSFSKAADLLFISQPAISKHIKNLEHEYNIHLFERKGNSILLTREGEILYEHVSNARNIQRKLEFEISIVKNKQSTKSENLIKHINLKRKVSLKLRCTKSKICGCKKHSKCQGVLVTFAINDQMCDSLENGCED